MDKWFNNKLDTNRIRRPPETRDTFINPRIKKRISITNWFIIINSIVFVIILLMSLSGINEDTVQSIFALQANKFFSGDYWTLLTSMFSHFWFPHLLFNLISLFFLGNFLEKIIGRKKFFWFYLISGIFAGLFFVVLSFMFGNSPLGAKMFTNPNTFAVGASGAIFGIAGLLAILTPRMKVYLIVGPILALIIESLLMSLNLSQTISSVISLLINVYIFISIFIMFSFNPKIRKLAVPVSMPFWLVPIVAIGPLIIISLFIELPIGNTAHLGGLIAGFVYGIYLKKKFRKKTAMLNKIFSE